MAVYLIRTEISHAVKIGHTSVPDSLMTRYQIGSHEKLTLIRLIEDGWGETETWLHRRYQHRRIRSEWFWYCPTMLTVEPPKFVAKCLKASPGWQQAQRENAARGKRVASIPITGER